MPARRVRKSLAMLTALVSALAIVAFVAPGSAGAAGTTVWVAKPMCAAAAPGHRSCLGMRLVRERATSAEQSGVRARSARPALADGPAGGYTPAQLAKAYGVNVNAAAASTQTVAIVDAFDDPSVKTDLAAFDALYGIPAETSSSFRVVNQDRQRQPAADGRTRDGRARSRWTCRPCAGCAAGARSCSSRRTRAPTTTWRRPWTRP